METININNSDTSITIAETVKMDDVIKRIKNNIAFNKEIIDELSKTFMGKIINHRKIETLKIINTNLQLLILNTKKV